MLVVLDSPFLCTHAWDIRTFGSLTAYVFCGQSNESVSNPVVVVDVVFTVLQLSVAVVSLLYLYQRLSRVIDTSESHTIFKLHCAYVIVFIVLWLSQVGTRTTGNDGATERAEEENKGKNRPRVLRKKSLRS